MIESKTETHNSMWRSQELLWCLYQLTGGVELLNIQLQMSNTFWKVQRRTEIIEEWQLLLSGADLKMVKPAVASRDNGL